MPPWREWYCGREAIRAFLAWAWRSAGYGPFRLVPTAANRQPAFAQYVRGSEPEWRAHAIWLLTLQDDAIAALTGFIHPRPFAAFALPTALPTQGAAPAVSRA